MVLYACFLFPFSNQQHIDLSYINEFLQMVDRLDDGTIIAELGPLDYKGLYKAICYEKFLWTGNVGY